MIAPGVTHAAPRRRGLPGNERHDRLLEVLLDPRRGLFLRRPADLADHDHRIGFRIVLKQRQRVDVRGADQRIAADADAGALPLPLARQLIDRLVGQRAALRDDADAAFLADVRGNDAGLALARRDDARAVRTDQPRVRVILRGRSSPSSCPPRECLR